jgi:hypothetical protein
MPTKKLRVFSDFLQEDTSQYLTIVPERVRIDTGTTEEDYIILMEMEVDRIDYEAEKEVQRKIQQVEDDKIAIEELKDVFIKVLNQLRVHFRTVCFNQANYQIEARKELEIVRARKNKLMAAKLQNKAKALGIGIESLNLGGAAEEPKDEKDMLSVLDTFNAKNIK